MKRRRPDDRRQFEIARTRAEKMKGEEKHRVWKAMGKDLKADLVGTK